MTVHLGNQIPHTGNPRPLQEHFWAQRSAGEDWSGKSFQMYFQFKDFNKGHLRGSHCRAGTLCSMPVCGSSGSQEAGIQVSSPGAQSHISRDTTDLELFNPTPGSCCNYVRLPHITSVFICWHY